MRPPITPSPTKPSVILAGAARPVRSVGGLSRGAPRLRLACRDSFQLGAAGPASSRAVGDGDRADLELAPRVRRQPRDLDGRRGRQMAAEDRKSTRLNSSHLVISYAVFCL